MLKFALMVLFLQWASKKPVGYKIVNRNDPRYMELDEVIEYYEQRKSGYYDL